MAWTYNASDLDASTASGRLNVVRFLIGDTDTVDQQVQDEEIAFLLSEANDNPRVASAKAARALASKYSRLVTTEIDGQITMEYGELAANYKAIADDLEAQAKAESGSFTILTGTMLEPRIKRDAYRLLDHI